MIKCPNCGQELPDQTKFCRYCGSSIAQEPAQAPAYAETNYYAEQPSNYADPYAAADANGAAAQKSPIDAVKGIFSKVPKNALIAVVAIILVVAIIIGIVSIAGGGKNDFALYMKDGELYYSDFSDDPIQITDDLNGMYAGAQVSENGKVILYIDEGDLYYRSLKNAKKEPTKIASDVDAFVLAENNKTLVYTKGDKLYYTSNYKKEAERVAKDINDMAASEDLKKIYYTDSDNDLYFIKSGKPADGKIASDAVNLDGNKKLSVLYFEKETDAEEEDYSPNDLYMVKGTKEPVKVSDDASTVSVVYDSGATYFVKVSDDEDDDEPASESLYYYDGKKETLISENYNSGETSSFEKPIYVFTELDSSDEDAEETYAIAVKGKYAAINAEDATSFKISDNNKKLYFLTIEEEEEEDKDEDEDEYSDDYYADEEYYYDSEATYTLYKASITGSGIKEPTSVDTEIEDSSYRIINNNKAAYLKDESTLYVDGKKIDDDVSSMTYHEETKTLYYKSDVSEKDYTYTLSKTKGSKAEKIADDVSDYQVTDGGKVYYIGDYDDGEGTLYLAKGSKPKKIDDDVSSLVSYHMYSGSDYYGY